MSEITLADKKVKTTKFRVSYPNLVTAKAFKKGAEPKYSITMLFDKTEDLSALKKAVFKAKVEEFGADQTKWPKKFRSPFRDGDADKPGDPAYKGKYFITASAKEDKKPQVVNNERQIIDPKEIYAGCYARATMIAFVYGEGANDRGASFALMNLQKLGDGKKFGGKRDAADEFEEVEDQSDADALDGESEEMEVEESEDDLGF